MHGVSEQHERVCQNECHDEDQDGPKSNADEHVYGDWVIVTEAQAGVVGEQKRECEACGHVETEEIPALPVPATPLDPVVARYIVQWLDEDGNALKDAEVRDPAAVGTEVKVTETDKEEITVDGSVYSFDAENDGNVLEGTLSANSPVVLTLYFKKTAVPITPVVPSDEARYVVQWLDKDGNALKDAEVRGPAAIGDEVAVTDADKAQITIDGSVYSFDSENKGNVLKGTLSANSPVILKLYFEKAEVPPVPVADPVRVYVYVQIQGETQIGTLNDHGWYTIGYVDVPADTLEAADTHERTDKDGTNMYWASSDQQSAVVELLSGMKRFDGNKGIEIDKAIWSPKEDGWGLHTSDGADDYVDNGTNQWHLDGLLVMPEEEVPAHPDKVNYTVQWIDADTNTVITTATRDDEVGKTVSVTTADKTLDNYSYCGDDYAGTVLSAELEESGTVLKLYFTKVNAPEPTPEPEEITITWLPGYGENEAIKTEKAPKGTTEVDDSLYPANPTRDGYTFTRWGEPVIDEETGNITITAQWSYNGGGDDDDWYTPPTDNGDDNNEVEDIEDENPPLSNLPEEEEVLDDEDVPLAEEPEELVDLDEEDVPLADLPEEVELEEDPVPLDAVPQTGDESRTAFWAAASLLSLGGMIALFPRKKREDEV